MQESKISVSREILNFLTGVYYEKGKEDIASRKERIFDRAFYLAYKDMATHTVAYYREEYEKYIQGESRRCAENRKKVREAIKKLHKKVVHKRRNRRLFADGTFRYKSGGF